MGLARQLTRNVGRNQIKELRSSDYPQAGLRESILLDAVNTSVTGTNVIAIRCNNHFEPTIINSLGAVLSNSTNFFNIPFLNMKKGTNGNGITFANDFIPSAQNKSVAVAFLNNSRKQIRLNQSSVSSFVVTPQLNNTTYDAVASNNNSNLILVGNPNKSVIISENRGGQLFSLNNYIEAAKGGVKNVITQVRADAVIDFLSFNSKNTGIGFLSKPLSSGRVANFINEYRVAGIEPLGTLTYSQTNTNQNNNAAWLLKQRTQYQRQFNKLKTLGV